VDPFFSEGFADNAGARDRKPGIGTEQGSRLALVGRFQPSHPCAVGLYQQRVVGFINEAAHGFGIVAQIAVLALAFGDDAEGSLLDRLDRSRRVIGHRDARDLLVEDRNADRGGNDGPIETGCERIEGSLLPAGTDDTRTVADRQRYSATVSSLPAARGKPTRSRNRRRTGVNDGADEGYS
jgi:hypothetical protein